MDMLLVRHISKSLHSELFKIGIKSRKQQSVLDLSQPDACTIEPRDQLGRSKLISIDADLGPKTTCSCFFCSKTVPVASEHSVILASLSAVALEDIYMPGSNVTLHTIMYRGEAVVHKL